MKKIEIVQALIEINKTLDSLSIHNLIGKIIETNDLPCPCSACSGEEKKEELEEKETASIKDEISGLGVIAGVGNKEEMLAKLKEVLDVVKSGNFDKLQEMAEESAKRLGKKRVKEINKMVKDSMKNRL